MRRVLMIFNEVRMRVVVFFSSLFLLVFVFPSLSSCGSPNVAQKITIRGADQ